MRDTVEQRAARILAVALAAETVAVAIELERVAAELLAPVKPDTEQAKSKWRLNSS